MTRLPAGGPGSGAFGGPGVLELVAEAKIGDLLPGRGRRFEASGVQALDGFLYVVFDDGPEILRVSPDWDAAAEPATLVGGAGDRGYEDIAYLASADRWYCLVEASPTESGGFTPSVDEYDKAFRLLASHRLDFPVARENKGIEGLSTLRLGDEDLVLGLCEGNACKSGSAGREPGKGRIQVFRPSPGTWQHVGTIKLPRAVQFEDYAGLDVRGRSMTVISQLSSAMWVGRLKAHPSGLDDLFEDDGTTYLFPRDHAGHIVYCNIEGVTWLPDGRLVVVSDRAKVDEQSQRCRVKDQSVHIFRLPGVE